MAEHPHQSGGRMESVRRNYDVPAHRGRRVLLTADPRAGTNSSLAATIISSTGSHLYVRTDEGERLGPLHPCWCIDYLDGRGDRTGQPTPMDRAWADA